MLSLFHYYLHLGSSSSRRCSASGSTLHLTGRNAPGRRRDKSAFFDRFFRSCRWKLEFYGDFWVKSRISWWFLDENGNLTVNCGWNFRFHSDVLRTIRTSWWWIGEHRVFIAIYGWKIVIYHQSGWIFASSAWRYLQLKKIASAT